MPGLWSYEPIWYCLYDNMEGGNNSLWETVGDNRNLERYLPGEKPVLIYLYTVHDTTNINSGVSKIWLCIKDCHQNVNHFGYMNILNFIANLNPASYSLLIWCILPLLISEWIKDKKCMVCKSFREAKWKLRTVDRSNEIESRFRRINTLMEETKEKILRCRLCQGLQ